MYRLSHWIPIFLLLCGCASTSDHTDIVQAGALEAWIEDELEPHETGEEAFETA